MTGQRKVRWGVLSTADIGVTKVIPAMQQCQYAEVIALASRDRRRAERSANALGIAKAYGSYEELLADKDVEAIYNPLPNHLHVPWSVKAAEAGKHVLCEKPLAMTVAEARLLLACQKQTHVKIGEAFMIRSHPQWQRTRELVASGRVGDLRSVVGFFSYFNRDPGNIRNIREYGGGALLDIGCYTIHISRLAFAGEPSRVLGLIEPDPEMGIDRLTSAIMDFPSGHAIFTTSTQLVPYQRVQLLGTCGRIEIEVPFNAPNDQPCRIFIDDQGDTATKGLTTEVFDICDQYTLQTDAFSRAILGECPIPVPISDAIGNLAVIEALFRSTRSGKWEVP